MYKYLCVMVILLINLNLKAHNFPEAISSGYFLDDLFKDISFEKPVALRTPPNEKSLYIVEKTGKIFKIENLSNPKKELFLDISERVIDQGESGLLSIEFHPNYATNKTYFLFYSTMQEKGRFQRISKFVGKQETVLIEQFDEAGNHNGGDMHFGPDGYLYIGVGDEGLGGDVLKNSQLIDKDYFAGILRIDVDLKKNNLWPNNHPAVILNKSGKPSYKVPNDNPFVNADSFNNKKVDNKKVIKEFWATGLRNPWRMSFDKKGNLWIGEVGQGFREEIDIIPAGQGGMNFGWKPREGLHPFKDMKSNAEDYDDPVYEYARTAAPLKFIGRSVTGGVVYEGNKLPEFTGKYIFGDYASGNVWALSKSSPQYKAEYITNTMGISAFGFHPASGEVLACALNEGKIKILKKSEVKTVNIPQKLSDTGIFKDVKSLTVNSSFIPYESNAPAWFDNAIESKWVSVPKGKKFGITSNGPWNSPSGAVWVQHFDMEKVQGNPSTKFKLETRVLVKSPGSAYALNYKWNKQQTEAYLVSEGGETLNLKVSVNGKAKDKTWRIPGRMECMICHNVTGGYALGFHTRQINRDTTAFGVKQNFLNVLYEHGMLSKKPNSVDLNKKHASLDSGASLEKKARSYLDVNCSSCHSRDGTTPVPFDLRAYGQLSRARLFNKPLNNMGDNSLRVISKGKPEKSVLLKRMAASDGFTRMPFIGTHEVDEKAISVIEQWIKSLE